MVYCAALLYSWVGLCWFLTVRPLASPPSHTSPFAHTSTLHTGFTLATHWLHTANCTLKAETEHCTLHTTHGQFKWHTPDWPLHKENLIWHTACCTLQIRHYTLKTENCKMQTELGTLYTPNWTLGTETTQYKQKTWSCKLQIAKYRQGTLLKLADWTMFAVYSEH